MKSLIGWRRWLRALTNPAAHAAVEEVLAEQRIAVPTLWLLGKTGAGKTSLVQKITGDSRASIGNGFEPCTRTASLYEHPVDAPVMRFLDTRGLGEAGYDPTEDLAAAESGAHAVLVLTRVDDTAQQAVLDVLAALKTRLGIRRHSQRLPLVHIHTAADMLDESTRARAVQFNHEQLITVVGRDVAEVVIDFAGSGEQHDQAFKILSDEIVNLVPELGFSLQRNTPTDAEQGLYLDHRREILGYAAAAAAVDAFPAVGLVGVPSLQGKMLHALAARYGVDWDRRVAGEFVALLGAGFLYRYALSLSGRQLMKLVPVWGQTAGAATAASISFASTYGLGRAACLYLYRRRQNEQIDTDTLRAAFRKAFSESGQRE